jgi:hypothetical protein
LVQAEPHWNAQGNLGFAADIEDLIEEHLSSQFLANSQVERRVADNQVNYVIVTIGWKSKEIGIVFDFTPMAYAFTFNERFKHPAISEAWVQNAFNVWVKARNELTQPHGRRNIRTLRIGNVVVFGDGERSRHGLF